MRSFRLSPIPQSDFYIFLAIAYRFNEQYEKAIEVCKKALSGNPDLLPLYLTLAVSYSCLDRAEEAHRGVEEVLRIQPHFSLEYYANILPYKNQEKLDKYINALRQAGLPE